LVVEKLWDLRMKRGGEQEQCDAEGQVETRDHEVIQFSVEDGNVSLE
jgi:hypothetical protein